MSLTPEQNRSMDRFLSRSSGISYRNSRKASKEFEYQEKSKAKTEDILDGALKQIEEV